MSEVQLAPEEYPFALPILKDLRDRGVVTNEDLRNIYVHSERIYQHAIVQLNYTTYDCRRGQDTLNSSTTRRDLMCLRREDEPDSGADTTVAAPKFLYGHLLGVFHVNIVYTGPGMLDHRPRRFDILWVRWYEPLLPTVLDSTIWTTRRLGRLSLVPLSDPAACDFVDPSDVVRAAHIIPRFSTGKRYGDHDLQSGRLFSKWARDQDEWKEYFVNV